MLETQQDNPRRMTLPVVTDPCLLDRARCGAGGEHSPTAQNGYDRTGGKRITAFNISQSILKNGYDRTRFRGCVDTSVDAARTSGSLPGRAVSSG